MQNATVMACKLEDGDGDLLTVDDQEALADWPLYLTIDGVRQTPGKASGADGCATWSDLDPGVDYGVEEGILPGWLPLAPIYYAFGVAAPGGAYDHTFINVHTVGFLACKLEDGDGDLDSVNDQTREEGWDLYLTIDGVRQIPGKTGGSDGCATWSGLIPDVIYGVEEGARAGWQPLTPISYTFGSVTPDATFIYDFINVNTVDLTACKQEDSDGELETTDDRTPLEGWPISLWIDGVEVAQQVTGADGCVTWVELMPGYAYSVIEGETPGWTALTPISHDFGLVDPGAELSHIFINAQIGNELFLPLVVR